MREGFIFINNNVFETLLALSEDEQSSGLMNIEPPLPNMSFVYHYPKVNFFWMKNTKAPLDILFCLNNKISEICYGEPFSTKIIGSQKFSDLVIELPYGSVDNSNIKIGQSVGLIKPSLQEIIIAKEISGNFYKL